VAAVVAEGSHIVVYPQLGRLTCAAGSAPGCARHILKGRHDVNAPTVLMKSIADVRRAAQGIGLV